MKMCKAKGFPAIDPDNVDGYSNKNGLGLTAEQQLDYSRFLAAEAHGLGLAVSLKNDIAQVADLVNDFDLFHKRVSGSSGGRTCCNSRDDERMCLGAKHPQGARPHSVSGHPAPLLQIAQAVLPVQ